MSPREDSVMELASFRRHSEVFICPFVNALYAQPANPILVGSVWLSWKSELLGTERSFSLALFSQ